MRKHVKTKAHILSFVLIVFLIPAVSLTYMDVAQATDDWKLELTFQVNNGTALNGTQLVFAPFDLITLKAELTNTDTAVLESIVVFSIKGPTSAANSTEIVRSEATDKNNSASIDFRIPIESTENIIGTWQVYVNAKTVNKVWTQNATFQVSWPIQRLAIDFVDAQGHSQNNFNAGDSATALISYESSQVQPQNISLNIKDSAGNSITQQIRQVTANTTTNNKIALEFTIPKSAANGSAQADLNIYSGNYQNRNIPATENKTVYLTIGTTTETQPPTPTPPPTAPTPTPEPLIDDLMSWLPWLAAITGLITFCALFIFLKRKPNQTKDQPTPPTNSTINPTIPPNQPPPTIAFSEENIKSSLIQMQTILNQRAQPDLATQDTTTLTQLNNIALTTKKIQELQTALKIEQQHLNKNINELNQTIEKQENIIKNYYDTLRNEIKKAQQIITQDNPPTTPPTTEQKIERENQTPPNTPF
ncbi:MAG: hypothetical protein LBH74_00490 [Nitrososphaerota archaeon]|jgi:hypothetical protein|uniref:hypothetical protein n=1 Tax=Candidatus Bathycorpusculum sp. TaxID=2994959 RepID=UPI00282B29E5|nr:hypothetical protein [Candidatus Termitimicrobium sp.]MCL2431556.1 hypothetical protein [Candidatus Termitimicrobium sp.]MDR0492107.1 hypothetical protein [Nitrososphaerota archaeon]